MDWNIITFETNRGEKAVDEFILSQQPKTQAKVVRYIRILKKYGSQLGMPHSKALGGGLYELRVRGNEEIRIFYCFTADKTIHLLHIFKKHTQQTPKKELEIALVRMKNLKRV